MNVTPNPETPYTPAGGSYIRTGNVGGLQSIPSSTAPVPTTNPLPPALQSGSNLAAQGRGQDSQLVHMTPDEVNSLRGLAQRFGGDLTTNPQTGLPEAGWLGKLLPTILGIAGAAVGIPTWAIGLGGAAAGTAATGSLGKGLMIGLQAYGGAGLGNAVGLGGSISNNAFGLAGGQGAGAAGAGAAGAAATPPPPLQIAQGAPSAAELSQAATAPLPAGAGTAASSAQLAAAPAGPLNIAGNTAPIDVHSAAQAALPQGAVPSIPAPKGFLGRYSDAIKGGLPEGTPGFIKNAAPFVTGATTLSAINDAFTPTPKEGESKDESNYADYRQAPRKSIFDDSYANRDQATGTPAGTPDWTSPYMRPAPGVAPAISRPQLDTREKQYFDVVNPHPNVVVGDQGTSDTKTGLAGKGQALGSALSNKKPSVKSAEKSDKATGAKGFDSSVWNTFAAGGIVQMQSGGHVIPAFDVATLGNGSTAAGQRKLAKMGGMPITGSGDGVSDSIPAMIDGKHHARVADGEVYFPPAAVAKLGGNAKLYALMRGAEKARMRTKSGEPAKLRKGLA